MTTSERLRHARTYANLTQERLQELTGLSQGLISQIERGKSLTPEVAERIAGATGFSPAFLLDDSPLPELPEGSLRYRRRSTAPVRHGERFRAHVRQTLGVAESAAEGLKIPPVRVVPLGANERVDADTIEALAADAREAMGVGAVDPIPNVVRCAERAGVLVVGSSDEIEGHDGASFWPAYPEGRPVVCFTRGIAGDRQRFTISHELGHLYLHILRAVGQRDAEAEANRFAGAFLLPADAAREELHANITMRDLAAAKARWGISIAATIRRCLDLQIISADRRLILEKQISARGWRKNEPVAVRPEEPLMLRKMIETKYSGRRLSDVASEMGLPPMAVRDMIA